MTLHLSRRLLLTAAAAGITTRALAQDAPRDPLLERRRANLPPPPWGPDVFQPQVAVPGAPRPRPLQPARGSETTISSAALTAARAYAAASKSKAVLVSHRGRLQDEWFAPGVTQASILHTYNMQYTLLVLLIGIAIDEGRIASVDEPAARFLPEWRNDARNRITVRHLLEMTAGLELRFDANKTDGLYSRDARAYWGSQTEPVILNEYRPIAEPGTRFDYNYIVPEILKSILQRASGRPYQTLLSQRLWRPLGNHTAYLWLNRPGGEPHVDSALFSAPSDWLRVGEMMLAGGVHAGRRLVSASWLDAMRRPSGQNPNWGYMYLGSPFAPVRRMATDPKVTYVVRSAEPFAASDVAYIDGYGGQRCYISPSLGLVVVRIGDVDREWDNARLFNLLAGGLAA